MRTHRFVLVTLALVSCTPPVPASPPNAPSAAAPAASLGEAGKTMTTFDEDTAFLKAHGDVIVLAQGDARIALSPKYQGRVMTSAVASSAASLGWINRPFIEAGKTGTAFDNYGGEDRFWLGPEGGQYSLYFAPKAPFTFDRWQTPHAFQEGAWEVRTQTPTSVTFARAMKLSSYAGTAFELEVERTVRLLAPGDVLSRFGVTAEGAKLVAYETENRVTNIGPKAWTKETGLLSIWILAMFTPSADAHVAIPFEKGAGPIVNDRYFGKVPADRLHVHEDAGYLVLKCDGKYRSKIGLGPARAKSVLASYSEQAKLLTIVHYDKPRDAADYVNSMWEFQQQPYGGDVVNSYNDGPTEPGKPSLGGFYEMETSSPALALAPGASAVHTHRTFHFVGERAALDPIAMKMVGLGVGRIADEPAR